MDNEINNLLNEYFTLFPNDGLIPEWYDITDVDKKNILKEAISKKINIVETKKYKYYEEKVIIDAE